LNAFSVAPYLFFVVCLIIAWFAGRRFRRRTGRNVVSPRQWRFIAVAAIVIGVFDLLASFLGGMDSGERGLGVASIAIGGLVILRLGDPSSQ
jgi:hypothetical protein